MERKLSRNGILVVCVASLGMQCFASVPPELKAGKWFNNPDYRLNDTRDVLLFFFVIEDSARGKESLRYLESMNRLSRSESLVVIGLTSSSSAAAESLIEKRGAKFTIGAASRSVRDYKITRLPSVVRISRSSITEAGSPKHGIGVDGSSAPTWEELDLSKLESLANDLPKNSPQGYQEPQLYQMSTGELRSFISSDAFGMDRATGVRLLFDSLALEEFKSFATQRLELETDPWCRGSLEYYMDVASGDRMDDDQQSLSAKAAVRYKDNPDDPLWAEVKAYTSLDRERETIEGIWSAYHAHFTSAEEDTLVRRFAVEDLWHKCSDHSAARSGLLQVLGVEPDPSIRMIAAMALGERCEPGDADAVAVLEAAAKAEKEVLRTKPMMEFVAKRIQNGN